jgi:hypothetical protein
MSKMFKQFGKGGGLAKTMMRGGMGALAGMGGKQKFGRG